MAEPVGGTDPAELLVGESSGLAVAPVLALLCCFGGSESEGERDRLRVESTSGMANSVIFVQGCFSTDEGFQGACYLGRKGLGIGSRDMMYVGLTTVHVGGKERNAGKEEDMKNSRGDIPVRWSQRKQSTATVSTVKNLQFQ